jgi:Dolichyl-phosphate-mannose-protein mannosyltransferase
VQFCPLRCHGVTACWLENRLAQCRKVVLATVLCGGLLLRLYGINFGLPYLYDPDEPLFVSRAMEILAHRDLNPHWFGVPATTTIYMLSALYATIFGVGFGLGIFAGPEDFKALYLQNPTVFYLSGRTMIAAFGVTTILLTYMIGRRLFNRATGLLAAAFLALCPLHVGLSQLIRSDIQMSFLTLVVFWFCLDILHRQTWSSSVLAGFFAGVGAATKYPAVMVALIIVLAHIWSGSRHWPSLAKLLVAGGASVVGVFVASPFLFLDFGTVLANVAFEARPTHLGATGEGAILNLIWYLRGPLVEALSTGGLILGGIGIVLGAVSMQRERWLLIAFPVSFIAFIASLNLRWGRWTVPVIPFLCLLAAHAFYRIAAYIGGRWDTRLGVAAGLLLASSVAAPLLTADIVRGRELSGTDTRTRAREWMMEHVPTGSRVLLEAYTPQFSGERYKVFLVTTDGRLAEVDARRATSGVADALFIPQGRVGRLRDTEAIRQERVEYMVVSDSYERYRAERERYPEIVATYESLMTMGTKLYEIHRSPSANTGPTIRVYRFDRTD